MNPHTYKPKVSIVMSFYSEPLQWIRFAVESVLGQTFRDFELIVVCDNPENTDGLAYIRSLQDSRIRLIVNPENLGPTKSFNIAIAASSGEYIARMDADDICLPERLEMQVAYLDSNPEVSVCSTDTHAIDKDGKIIRRRRYRRKRNIELMFISNCIPHPSVMFRRSLLELRNPIYNEEYIYTQDYELWQFLLLKGCRFHMLDKVLLLYRKTRKQISSAKKAKQTELLRMAHRSLITDWLLKQGIISSEDCDDLKTMLLKSTEAFASHKDRHERKCLANIIYVLYYSLGTTDWKYRLKYLADSNLILFRVRIIFTLRLLFSVEKRRHRIGLV